MESEIPGSNPALVTGWICKTAILSFNSLTAPVNSQLISLPPVGILNTFLLDAQYLLLCLQCPQLAQKCQIHKHLNEVVIVIISDDNSYFV